jgi:hypothetical protein
MTTSELRAVLEANENESLHMMLPSGEFLPAHFHVTEVGRVEKDFIDCGGTRRKVSSCLIQVWTANDVGHRLPAGKLVKILRLASDLGVDGLPVEIEYGEDVASQYKLAFVEETPSGLLFNLVGKKTDCLAPDRCGVSGCC